MFKIGDKFLHTESGGITTITNINLDVETFLFGEYKNFRTYYTLRGNFFSRRFVSNVRLENDILNDYLERGVLKPFIKELEPKRYDSLIKFKFV